MKLLLTSLVLVGFVVTAVSYACPAGEHQKCMTVPQGGGVYCWCVPNDK